MRPARSSASGSTRDGRSRSPSGRSSIATTTRSSSVATGRAARTPPRCGRRSSGCVALGSPRTDFFFDEAELAAARSAGDGRLSGARRPAGRPLRPDLPRPGGRQAGGARVSTPRGCGPPCPRTTCSSSRRIPNLDPAATPTAGYDVVVDPAAEINELLAVDRHPDHRLLVLGRRVRPAAAGRSCCSSATSPSTRSTRASTSTTGPR